MDNYDAERGSTEDGWMWWNLFIGASAIAFALNLVPDADEWWEFATIVIMGVFALVVVTKGVRSLLARRRPAHRREASSGREAFPGGEAVAENEAIDSLEASARREAGAPREPS